jgi:Xaa-Pro dipeptidase
MKSSGIDQIIISDSTAIFYLLNQEIHSQERMLALYLNVNGNHTFVVSELFPIHDDLGMEIVYFSDSENPIDILTKRVEGGKVLGIDKNWPARFLLGLMEQRNDVEYKVASDMVDNLRMIKDEKEKELMRAASKLNDESIEKLINLMNEKLTEENLTEKELTDILGQIYKEGGAEGFSFTPIIAFGANAADPHAIARDVNVKPGDVIMIDIGCVKDHYCSDMTRTIFYKEVPEKSREVFETVLEAQKRAEALVKPGVRMCDIDAACRDYITEKGYGPYFTHRTGHFIGLEDHDKGDVSSLNETVAQPGMIFSIEPGIYLQGDVGVRIEDLVLVTEDGCEVLNKYPKELVVIGK